MAETPKPADTDKTTADADQRKTEQTTPAEQWGERDEVGRIIESGGKKNKPSEPESR